MKLKEYPKSLFQQAKLQFANANALGAGSPKAPQPVIISLTTIPSRLHVVGITVRSLLAQTVQPERIILWLNEDLRTQLPSSLSSLVNDRFSIAFKPGTSSHRKLIFALQQFPEHTIVTTDDDLMYPANWLERLLAEQQAHPNTIIGHECRVIAYQPNGEVAPYKQWNSEQPGNSQHDTLAIGYGGTLYPPHSLHPDTTNETLYMQLTPKADDLWFKAMALRQNTPVMRSSHPLPKPVPIARSQKIALGHTNIKQDGNRLQWQAVCDFYNFKGTP